MKRAPAFLILLCLWMLPLAAQAQNCETQWCFGLAMHGQPKHSRADAHFNYANPNAPKGGHLNRAVVGSFDTLVPYTIKGKAAAGLGMTADALMARSWDEPFTMYPLVASAYKIAADRSWIEFQVNPKARFHDGSPITVNDIAFSFETLKQYGRPNMRRIYSLVSHVTQMKNSIRFTFGEGHDQETALILSMMPILSQSYWADKDFNQTTVIPPLSSGAYTIKAVDIGRFITYQRVKNHWAADTISQVGHHNFDTITFHYFRDDNIALESFKAGQTDLRYEGDIAAWQTAYDGSALKNGEIIQSAIPHQRPERAQGFIFNTRRAPFHDQKLRQALALLFDADWVNKNLYFGDFKRIHSYYPNAPFARQKTEKQKTSYRKRRKQAETLLADAGYIVDKGQRLHKDTRQPLSFEIILSSVKDEKIALNFAQTLKKAGIQATIKVMDSAAYRARMNDYDFDMTINYWQSSLSPGTEQSLFFGCKAANQPARWNYPGICRDDIDALAASIAQATSRQSLEAQVTKLDNALWDGHYMIPLFYKQADYYAHWRHIKRPESTALYGAVLETWWMDQTADLAPSP